jgi:CBS domain-containing protein
VTAADSVQASPTVGEVMSLAAPCLGDDLSLAQAAQLLTDCELTAIAACDEDGLATGLVTERDVARAIAQDEDPWMLEATAMRTGRDDDLTPAHPGDPLHEAVATMIRHQLWHLPVVLDDEPVGTLYLVEALARWPLPLAQELPRLVARARAPFTP